MLTQHCLFNISEPNALHDIRDWVRMFLKAMVNRPEVGHFVHAIDELCANIVEHRGEGTADPTTISIKLTCNFDSIETTIVYAGEEFNLVHYSPLEIDKLVKKAEPGGLGIRMIKLFTDKIEYDYDDRINTYTLVKNVPNAEVILAGATA